MKKYSANNILLVAIIAVGAFLRFYHYYSWSLTNDELSAIYGLSLGSLYNNINTYVFTDFHPAGVQIILWFWTKIFGTSVASIRLPFVLMGIASLWLNYMIARKWFNKNVALLATAALAVSQYAILYSQIARPYGSGIFFTLLMAHGWTGIVTNKSKNPPSSFYYFPFTSGMVLCMYNHYFSFLFAGIVGITGVFLINKQFIKPYLLCGVIAVALFLPHLKITINQFGAGGLGWLGPPDSDYFKIYFKYIFNGSKYFLCFIFLMALIAAIKLPLKLSVNKLSIIALAWFLIPLLTAYFYSIYVSPVLQHSILLFSFPFLLFSIFSFTPINQKLTNYIVVIILLAGIIQIRFVNHFNGSNEFARFKEIAEHIGNADRKYGEKNISHAINIVNPFYINYYLKGINDSPSFLFYHNEGNDSLEKVLKLVNASTTPYFMYCWTNSNNPYEINQIIKQKYPYLVERYVYFNCEYYLYSSKTEDKVHDLTQRKIIVDCNYENEVFNFKINKKTLCDSCDAYSGYHTEFLNSTAEYSSTYRNEIKNVIDNTSDIVNLSVMIKSESIPADALIVISLDNENQNYFWSGMNIKSFVHRQNEWTKCFYSVRLPQLKTPEDLLTVYIFNPNKKQLFIDDFCIESETGNPILYGVRPDAWMNEKLK